MRPTGLLLPFLPLLVTAAPLGRRDTGYTSGSSASDITDGVCAPLTVIFARGTTEPGTIGSIVGPPLFAALKTSLDNDVALQGVDYPASIEGNLNLGADGGGVVASLVAQQLKQCPSTKIALSGYSQGASVIHNSVTRSGGVPVADVAAVALFGDPLLRESVGAVPAAKVLEECASGDDVCQDGTFDISAAHLSYGSDANAAAAFLIKTAGVST